MIRVAGEADLPLIAALLCETWHATYDEIYGAAKVADISKRWHGEAQLARNLGTPGFLVSTDGGTLTGTVLTTADASIGLVDLHRLYVYPAHQSKGLGRALFDAAVACFPGAPGVRLEVEPANFRAIEFYQHLGFAVVGKNADCGCSGDHISALVMSKSLA